MFFFCLQLMSQLKERHPGRFQDASAAEGRPPSDDSFEVEEPESHLEEEDQSTPPERLATSTPARRKKKGAQTSQATAILQKMEARMAESAKAQQQVLAQVTKYFIKYYMLKAYDIFWKYSMSINFF